MSALLELPRSTVNAVITKCCYCEVETYRSNNGLAAEWQATQAHRMGPPSAERCSTAVGNSSPLVHDWCYTFSPFLANTADESNCIQNGRSRSGLAVLTLGVACKTLSVLGYNTHYRVPNCLWEQRQHNNCFVGSFMKWVSMAEQPTEQPFNLHRQTLAIEWPY